MTVAAPEYITKKEIDILLNGITDKHEADFKRTEERFASLEKLIDSKLTDDYTAYDGQEFSTAPGSCE